MTLTHYDPHVRIIVAADAPNTGLESCSYINFRISLKAIFHASQILTKAERHYSQIEKDLALVFVVSRLHKMLHDTNFTLCADHKRGKRRSYSYCKSPAMRMKALP